jgi:hypothetical protein
MLKSKFSLSRHFEYANEQITYHFWLWTGRPQSNIFVTDIWQYYPIRAFLAYFKWDDMIYRSPNSIGSLFVNCPIRRTTLKWIKNKKEFLYSVCNGFFTCMHVGFFQLYVHDCCSTWNTYCSTW